MNTLPAPASNLAALQQDAVNVLLAKRETEIREKKKSIKEQITTLDDTIRDQRASVLDPFRKKAYTDYAAHMRKIVSYLTKNLSFCLEDSDREQIFDEGAVTLSLREDTDTGEVAILASQYGRALMVGDDSIGEYIAEYEISPTACAHLFRIYTDMEENRAKRDTLYAQASVLNNTEKDREYIERQVRASVSASLLKQAGVDIDNISIGLDGSFPALALETKKQ